MIIYVSMLIVVAVIGVLDVFVFEDQGTGKASPALAALTMGYVVFWVGIRDAFIDTASYIRRFNALDTGTFPELDFQPGSGWGFSLLEYLFKRLISSDYHVWLMFLAVVSGICIGYTFFRYSKNFYYTVFLFIATTSFMWMMNGIRQFLACAIIFACTPLIEKRKWFWYFLVVLACSTIHATCIMMLPVYFLVEAKPWNVRMVGFFFGVLTVLFFTSQATNILEDLLETTSYAGVTEQFSQDDGVNPLRVLVFSVIPVLAYIGKAYFCGEEDRVVDICINMSVITAGLYAVGIVTSGILIGRLPIYTQMYQFIFLPRLLDEMFEKRSLKLLHVVSIILFLAYFYLMARGHYYSSEFTGRIY